MDGKENGEVLWGRHRHRQNFSRNGGAKVKIDFLSEHFRYIPFAIGLGF